MHLHLLRPVCLLAIFLFIPFMTFAQSKKSLSATYPKNSKVLYQTIAVEDKVGIIVVNIGSHQEFQYEYWQGDAVLVEQEIHLENAPNGVFQELMRKKRYDLSEQIKAGTLVLNYDTTLQKELRVNYKEVNEKVFLKLLVPEKMEVQLQRKG